MDHTVLWQSLTTLGLWLAFALGQILYILKCAGFALRNKKNPLNSRRQYVYLYWDILLYRAAAGAILFWFLVTYPQLLTKGISYLPAVPAWAANLKIPKIWPVFVVGGLVIDFALDWLFTVLATLVAARFPKLAPRLEKFLPHVPDDDSQDGGN